MKEQTYQIEKQNSFALKHIFECGQCFRWNQQNDGSYTGVFQNNVLNVKQEEKKIVFQGICEKDIKETITKYFDLDRNYEKIKKELEKIDEPLKNSIEYGNGIRILNQDLWETIISFIISANNNIPRIKGIIERISSEYGRQIKWKGKTFYTFPTPEELAKATVQDLRNLGLGFRDQRVYETTRMILNKQVDLEKIQSLAKVNKEKEENNHLSKKKIEEKQSDTRKNKKETTILKIRESLLILPGVGPKVADCIMLFSTLKCLEVFPIDVWVRRVMNELYFQYPQETKLKNKQIEELVKEKYGDLAGLAQQYLFYWKREA